MGESRVPDPDAAWNRVEPGPDGRWRQFTSSLPMRTALLAVAAVWVLGAVWSFQEQTEFATAKGFAFPHLLPLVIDGFAIAMAGVAWAASLDARPAIAARLATVVAVAASSASNGAWAFIRSNQDLVAVVLGVAVPIAANLAFEVLLAELRRQVQRRRGLPPPVAIPYPRLLRFVLAPIRTFTEWRRTVLELTAMEHAVARTATAASPDQAHAQPQVWNPTATTPEMADPEITTAALSSTHDFGGTSHGPTPSRPAAVGRATSTNLHPGPSPAGPAPIDSAPAAPALAAPARRNGSAGGVLPAASTPVGGPSASGTSTGGTSATAASPGRAAPETGDPSNDAAADSPNGQSNGGRRTVDQRVELLARHLASTEDAGEFTGEMVGPLLGIDVAPRTGRRLLGQARELVSRRAQEAGSDPELNVIGGR